MPLNLSNVNIFKILHTIQSTMIEEVSVLHLINFFKYSSFYQYITEIKQKFLLKF